MKFEKIEGKERVWVITRGPDGKIQGQLDPKLFAALHPELSGDELADAIIIAAGTAEIAETRAW